VDVKLKVSATKDGTWWLKLNSSAASERVRIAPVDQLAKIGGELRQSVEKTMGEGRIGLNLEAARGAELLTELAEAGSSALKNMLGVDAWRGPRVQAIERFFEKTVRALADGETPTLWLHSPVDLPLELMPVMPGRPEFLPSLANPAGERLATAAGQCFPGLHFAVRRVGLEKHTFGDQRLRAEPAASPKRVLVAPYFHMHFRQFEQEMRGLGNLSCFRVRDPRPDEGMIKMTNAKKAMAQMLIEGERPREEIVHVIAHCLSKEDSSYDHRFVFGGKGFRARHQVEVTVKAMDFEARYTPQSEIPDGPLAFLSACGAADIEYESPSTIPSTLLDAGYRAVIAPLVTLHPEPAREVARLFFDELSRARIVGETRRAQTVGEALVRSRHALIRFQCNPLAMLYVCYGESRLRIDTDQVSIVGAA
jgi:hypothetical protein